MQVPPEEAFEAVAKKLLAKKPVAVREERHRDPALAAAPQEEGSEEEGEGSAEQDGETTGSENTDEEATTSSPQEQPENSDSAE
jgi:hypothetical protein